MKDDYTATMDGLPDRKESIDLHHWSRHNVAAFMKDLASQGGAAGAGDRGSVMIYMDDNGHYRGYRSVYCMNQSEVDVTTKKELKVWLKEQIPQMD